MNSYFKWSLLVAINLPFSIMFALDFMQTIPTALGVVSGVILFIFLYASLERYLIRTQKLKWRRSLIIGVGSCAVFLLIPPFPMISGALALDLSKMILGLNSSGVQHVGFFSTFLTTVIDGFLLSLIVAKLAIFARLIFILKIFKEDK